MSLLLQALNHHGLTLVDQRQYGLAEAFFREAIVHDADFPDAHTNLGVTLFLQNRFAEADIALRDSLALRPDDAHTLLNLGFALWRMDELTAAKTAFQRAVALDGGPHHIPLGAVLWELADAAGAMQHCLAGVKHDPDSVMAHDTLRQIYQFSGDEAAAIAQCDELLRIASSYTDAAYKKSLMLLTYNNPAGWLLHECRYENSTDDLSIRGRNDPKLYATLVSKRWDGQSTGHLLVHREQGYGDNIQFLRFIGIASEHCEKLSLYLPPALNRMAQIALKQYPNVHICSEVPEQFDHWCLIMSLPYLLGITREFPNAPYLFAPRHRYNEVRRLPGLKIGLTWTGRFAQPDNHWRMVPFNKLARLFDVPHTQFVSLQFPSNIDLSGYPVLDVHPVATSFSGTKMIDWTETAGLIDALDLVISADTAVPHMVGALGKPIWLMDRYNTDWRYGQDRTACQWYPSMRIFRQPKMNDWDSVIDAVYLALQQAAS